MERPFCLDQGKNTNTMKHIIYLFTISFLIQSCEPQNSNDNCTGATSVIIDGINQDINFVSLSEGLNVINNNKLALSITFDDGFSDNLYKAAPILVQNKIPFTVFVCSDFVKHNRVDYLTKHELFQLSQLPGVTIGSHGATHTPFNRLKNYELKEELISSKKYLEDICSKRIDTLSYPHGAVDNRIIDYAINAGYKFGGTSNFNINKNNANPMALSRNVIMSYDNKWVFNQKLQGAYDWCSLIG